MPDFPTDKTPRRDNYETQRLQELARERLARPQPEDGPSLWSRLSKLVERLTRRR